jgi:hypothetical protein
LTRALRWPWLLGDTSLTPLVAHTDDTLYKAHTFVWV